MSPPPSEGLVGELIRACRTQIGDELGSMTYFTPTDAEYLYLRVIKPTLERLS
ncbi:DUF7522 family protein [Haladaptatus pallidirubidus]|uniref:Uncharacterized protein n=1 Tax=Haladaptatus pallidirubidus TaxID=1008152 RepID=A0AAV3UPS3_9EURY